MSRCAQNTAGRPFSQTARPIALAPTLHIDLFPCRLSWTAAALSGDLLTSAKVTTLASVWFYQREFTQRYLI